MISSPEGGPAMTKTDPFSVTIPLDRFADQDDLSRDALKELVGAISAAPSIATCEATRNRKR
jgi:hypothetical protein